MKLKKKLDTQKKLNNLQSSDIMPWASEQIQKACSFAKICYYTFNKEKQAFCLEYQFSQQGKTESIEETLAIQDTEDIFTKVYRKQKKTILRKATSNSFINSLFANSPLSSVVLYPIVVDEVIGLAVISFAKGYRLRLQAVASLSIVLEQIAGNLHRAGLKKELEKAKEKSSVLLANILPLDIAKELEEHGIVEPVQYDSLSILFTDFVGFSQISENLTPAELVTMLDGYFFYFDDISKKFDIERLKTIGDAYMCVGGLHEKDPKIHAIKICLAALEFCNFTKMMMQVTSNQDLTWDVRIGINTGPAIAGVVGKTKFAFDIWGSNVNIASRMESSSKPGKVNISMNTYNLVKDYFETEYRGTIEVKHGQQFEMYFLHKIKEEYSDSDGIYPNEKFLDAIGFEEE
ncbi:MAG: adenylate/guanylate cyclase domain-containing protein [Spirochaetota bacterium]